MKNDKNQTDETVVEEVDTTVEEAEVEVLDETTLLENEVKELKDKVLRQVAEFDNFKKRTQREKEELSAYTKGECFKEVLNVLDNFERAMQTECKDEVYKQGIEMVFNGLKQAVSAQGIEEIDAEGKDFDPQFHNAVSQIQDDNFGENQVAQVFQKGYKINGKVIRHAMVVVANA